MNNVQNAKIIYLLILYTKKQFWFLGKRYFCMMRNSTALSNCLATFRLLFTNWFINILVIW